MLQQSTPALAFLPCAELRLALQPYAVGRIIDAVQNLHSVYTAFRLASVYFTYSDTALPVFDPMIEACFEVNGLFHPWTEQGPTQLFSSYSRPRIAALPVGTSCVETNKASCLDVACLFGSWTEHKPTQLCAPPPSVDCKGWRQSGM